MRVVQADVGMRGFDTVAKIDHPRAEALRSAGFDFAVRYLGKLSLAELKDIVGAGLGCMAVTYANRFDGLMAVAELRVLGMPQGATVWLDAEDVPMKPLELQRAINAWANALRAAGYDPGLYVGSGVGLTSAELYSLGVDRYWHSLSRVLDRHGQLAEPGVGWCMHQLYPSVQRAGVLVDVDVIQQDYKARVPSMVMA